MGSHNLARQLSPGSSLAAAGACGVQNTPPGSAAPALQARGAGLAPDEIDTALVENKALLQSWSLRAAPDIFPTGDLAIFTLGLLPLEESAIRTMIRGVEPALDRTRISAVELVELTAAALWDELDGRALT